MSKESDPIKKLKKIFPSGAHLFCEFFERNLVAQEKLGNPLEAWGREEWVEAESILKTNIDFYRNEYHLDEAKEQGLTPEEFKSERRQFRKLFQERRQSAMRSFTQVRDLIQKAPPHIKNSHLSSIRDWRKQWGNPNIKPENKMLPLAYIRDEKNLTVPSDMFAVQIANTLQDGRNFDKTTREGFPVASGLAYGREWSLELLPIELGEARDGLGFLTPAPDFVPKAQMAMARYAEQLSDRDSDLITLLMGHFSVKAKSPDDQVLITLDEIMETLGYSKHKGGYGESYKKEEKDMVRSQVVNLQNNYLTIAGAIKRERKFDAIQSRVFIIYDRTGQTDFSGVVTEWKEIKIGFGRAWSTQLFDERGKLTMALQKQALKYHYKQEVYEKRIAKNISVFWRLNMKKTSRTMTTYEIWTDYLAEATEDLDRRKAERLDEALDRLKADKIIGDWQYLDGTRTREMNRFAKGWQREWFKKEIEIETTKELLELNIKHLEEAKQQKPRAKLEGEKKVDTTGADFRKFRVSRNISGLTASKMLGIDNSLLSKFEQGLRIPTEYTRLNMQALMRDIDNRPDILEKIANK